MPPGQSSLVPNDSQLRKYYELNASETTVGTVSFGPAKVNFLPDYIVWQAAPDKALFDGSCPIITIPVGSISDFHIDKRSGRLAIWTSYEFPFSSQIQSRYSPSRGRDEPESSIFFQYNPAAFRLPGGGEWPSDILKVAPKLKQVKRYSRIHCRGGAVNPSDAVAFLNRIRDRFSAHEPEKYTRFLDIMRAYQRGQQRKDLVKTYADVKALLADHSDLLRDFEFFMPKNSGIAYMDADQDEDGEVEVTGERTLAERNAAGFANAIMIDDDDDDHRDDAASRDEQDELASSAAELLMPTRREAAELLMPTRRRSARKRGRVEQ